MRQVWNNHIPLTELTGGGICQDEFHIITIITRTTLRRFSSCQNWAILFLGATEKGTVQALQTL